MPTDGRTVYVDVSIKSLFVVILSKKHFRSEQEMEISMAHSHKDLLLPVRCFISYPKAKLNACFIILTDQALCDTGTTCPGNPGPTPGG